MSGLTNGAPPPIGIATLCGGFAILLLAAWVFLGRMLRLSVRDVLSYE